MPLPETYENCSCPHCNASLHTTSTSEALCPNCSKRIKPMDVWQTRRDPGTLHLPGWLRAFGWPFLVMLLGGGMYALAAAHFIDVDLRPRGWYVRIAGAIFAIGFIHFLYKFFMDGDD